MGVYERILLPTDGSDASERAVEEAIGLAVRFDAGLTALSVADTSGFQSPGPTASAVDDLEADAADAVDIAADRARDAGVDPDRVETAVEHGDPADEIRDRVAADDADLIVMGTHGRDGIERRLLGSVAEHTVRDAGIPVLTVPADPGEDERRG